MLSIHETFLRAIRASGLFLLFALSLYGHAILLSAVPSAKELVNGPNVTVKLRFNSRIDAKRSRVTLVASDGQQTVLTIEEQASADSLSTVAKGLKRGSYIVLWQVLANDGHITRGEVPFQVQ